MDTKDAQLETLELAQVRADVETQSRAALSSETIEEYARLMEAGETFPPIDTVFDGTTYFAWDGSHRVHAARKAGKTSIRANVTKGTADDARWLACGANRSHGLKRSNADKERAVKVALSMAHAAEMTDGAIADHCGVSREMVRQYREVPPANLQPLQVDEPQPKRKGKDGKVRDTTKIAAASKETAKKKRDEKKPKPGAPVDPNEDADLAEPTELERQPGEDDIEIITSVPKGRMSPEDKAIDVNFGKLQRAVDAKARIQFRHQGKNHSKCMAILKAFFEAAKFWRESGTP